MYCTMNAKKKLLSIGLAASLAAIAVAGSSLAYFTDSETQDNEYTIGNVDIVLYESSWGSEEANDLYPGEPVAKDPTVLNDGANPAFVRIKVEGAEQFTFRTNHQEGYNTEKWDLHDGYYYYKGVLEPGVETEALFDQIVLNPETENGNGEQGHILVTAEAIQAQGAAVQWNRVQNMSTVEIANWFENQTQIPYDPEF